MGITKIKKAVTDERICDIYEGFIFNDIAYKKELSTSRSISKQGQVHVVNKLNTALALNEYIDNKLDRKKIRKMNLLIKKLSWKFLPYVFCTIAISAIMLVLLIVIVAAKSVQDGTVIGLAVTGFVSIIIGATILGIYTKKYIKLKKAKADYFAKTLKSEIKLTDLKSEIFKKFPNFSYKGFGPIIPWAKQIYYPDIPKNYSFDTNKESVKFSLYGMSGIVQDYKLQAVQKEDGENNVEDSKLNSNSIYYKVFNLTTQYSDLSLAYIPFLIFNDLNVFNNKMALIDTGSKDINDLFKVKSVKSNEDTRLTEALQSYSKYIDFDKYIDIKNSAVYYYNYELKAVIAIKDHFNFNNWISQKELDIPLNASIPDRIKDNDALPFWLIINNFYKIVDYIALNKTLFDKYLMPIVFYLLNGQLKNKVFEEKELQDLYRF